LQDSARASLPARLWGAPAPPLSPPCRRRRRCATAGMPPCRPSPALPPVLPAASAAPPAQRCRGGRGDATAPRAPRRARRQQGCRRSARHRQRRRPGRGGGEHGAAPAGTPLAAREILSFGAKRTENGVKIWLEHLLQIIRPWNGEFNTGAADSILLSRSALSSLCGLVSVTATCVFLKLSLQPRSSVRDTAAHRPSPRGPREEYSLKISARSHCKSLQHSGRSTCYILDPAWKRGHQGRTRLSQPPIFLCAPNLQEKICRKWS
jgi:hypothetical protein